MKKYYAVVPDIHGYFEPLAWALEWIDSKRDEIEKVVFLGDYVDRGRDSPKVLDLLSRRPRDSNVFIRGNHDQMMLDYLEYPDGNSRWYEFWGAETASQFRDRWKSGGLAENPGMAPYADFIRQTAFSYETDLYIFVHAAIDPFKPMTSQSHDMMLWGNHQFCYNSVDRLVVTGHIIMDQPTLKNNHLALDTGAYHGGGLTVALLPTAGMTIEPVFTKF
jgi:serine/threonine protein phosphatase 1